MAIDTYASSLEHNDRIILEGQVIATGGHCL